MTYCFLAGLFCVVLFVFVLVWDNPEKELLFCLALLVVQNHQGSWALNLPCSQGLVFPAYAMDFFLCLHGSLSQNAFFPKISSLQFHFSSGQAVIWIIGE